MVNLALWKNNSEDSMENGLRVKEWGTRGRYQLETIDRVY